MTLTEPAHGMMTLPSAESAWIRDRFKEYYSTHAPSPSELARREFGFGFERKIDYRHKAFAGPGALKEFLVREGPKYVSYSTAYYDLPAARPMENKGYRGADLVFDLDTTYAHEPHPHQAFLCPYCLGRVKQDAQRLVEDFLVRDFGFNSSEVWVKFSGSKGYHVHVQTEAVRQLSAQARKQLLGYVTAQDVKPEAMLVKQPLGNGRYRLQGPTVQAQGWRGIFYRTARQFLEGCTVEKLVERGARKAEAERIVQAKPFVLEQMEGGNWDCLPGLRKVWPTVLEQTKSQQGLEVDQSVTFDLHRIIRLEDSLHGDTGLIAKKISGIGALEQFDPLKDALSLDVGKTASVVPNSDITLELFNQTFELKTGKKIELPEPAVLLILCKHKGVLTPAS